MKWIFIHVSANEYYYVFSLDLINWLKLYSLQLFVYLIIIIFLRQDIWIFLFLAFLIVENKSPWYKFSDTVKHYSMAVKSYVLCIYL